MILDTFVRAATRVTFELAAGAAQAQFQLTSPDFTPGGNLRDEQAFDSFGCTGKNVSPALEWSGAPADAQSFALLVHDPDAPTGGAGWWHWLVYDIPADTTRLAKGAGKADGSALPQGAGHCPCAAAGGCPGADRGCLGADRDCPGSAGDRSGAGALPTRGARRAGADLPRSAPVCLACEWACA